MKTTCNTSHCEGEEVFLAVAHYSAGGLALLVEDAETGQPMFKASVFSTHKQPAQNCIWVKDWMENEGVLDWLISIKVARRTGRGVQCGYEIAHEVELSPELLAQLEI